MNEKPETRLERLREILKNYQSVVVAYSGGVDSTFLLKVAGDVLGDRVMAVTVSSGLMPPAERDKAAGFAREMGVDHQIIRMEEMEVEGIRENCPRRCYYCKRHIFSLIRNSTAGLGYQEVVDASNMDDLRDYRPGMDALRELGIKNPLIEAGINKADIVELSRQLAIPGRDRPADACLASRIPYGEEVTPRKLRQVEEGERILHRYGFRKCRLRHHGDIARIEIDPSHLDRLTDESLRGEIAGGIRELGFAYVTLDLQGYRTGSLNELLDKN